MATAGAYVFDTFAHFCGEALQLHGGIGFTWEHDVHLFVRRAKVNQVLYGDGIWHRERLVRLLEQTNRRKGRDRHGCDRPRDSRLPTTSTASACATSLPSNNRRWNGNNEVDCASPS